MKRELTEKRTLTSKTFDNGDGTRTVSLHQHPIHYGESGDMKDIDITLKPGTYGCSMDAANYSLHIIDTPGITKIRFGKNGEWIEFDPYQLRWVNDEGESSVVANFDNSTIGNVIDNEITWVDAFGSGIDLMYGCEYGGIYKKVIFSDFIDAPENIKSGTNPMLEVVLKYMKSPVKVKIDGVEFDFNGKRKVRLENVRFSDLWELKLPRFGDAGVKHSSASEQHEDVGVRHLSKDEITTSVPYSWLVKAIYPVFIDTDINEQIGIATDDCYQEGIGESVQTATVGVYIGMKDIGYGTWRKRWGGFRWQTVNIPNGAHISAAKLSLYLTTDIGTLEARITGIDEDNTITWANANGPYDRTKTTATVQANESDWNSWAVDSWMDIDISGIIHEIVSRSGWSANNALAVVVENTELDEINKNIVVRSYNYTGNAHGAKLDVTYAVIGRFRINGGLVQ